MSTATQIVPEKTVDLPSHYLSLLIVACEREVRDCCQEVAQDMRFRVRVADTASTALRMLDSRVADLVLLDSGLAGRDGIELLDRIKQEYPETEVVVVSGHPTVESVLAMMKSGAYDCLRKPFQVHELKALLERAIGHFQSSLEGRLVRESLRNNPAYAGLLGQSREMEKLRRIIAKVALGRHPVLIQGESGTGKEMAARAIHFQGPFRDKPFLPVDCGSLVPSSLESELFGCAKPGAAGGVKSRAGLFSLASGGTIFLDEIGDMPMDMQSKLARAMQEREIRPVGSAKGLPFDARIIAATSDDLETAMEEGRFRRDLHLRLNIVNLRLPALRERKEDLRLLTEHFLDRFSRIGDAQLSVSADTMKVLRAYDWPGNVRELESCLQCAAAVASSQVLEVRDLPPQVHHAKVVTLPSGVRTLKGRIVSLAEMEKQAILAALHQCNGDKLTIAKLLGIGKTTLYRKIKEYKISDQPAGPPPDTGGRSRSAEAR
ncbi:MAG TPA: sigma-54 dependent transcriptional regulator [Verrucomicrobiae bacterium]|jgi:DNA-binding NtrC family response regulator|nr:sigma-54 dependent transcriptional regulator [Verrucomicrobiae bacterium]